MHEKLLATVCAVVALGCAPVSTAHERVRPLVVDTDVALDDVRALSLLLQHPGVDLLAVVTSDGGSSPCDGAIRGSRVLETLGRTDDPVGVGRDLGLPPPPWRSVADILDRVGEGGVQDCRELPAVTDMVLNALGRNDQVPQ